jgi:hypothetical protein
MGGDKDTQTQIIRYAPYLEQHHQEILDIVRSNRTRLLVNSTGFGPPDSSPYKDYVDFSIEDAFFGAGYALGSFPSLYDMYGKFMAGLDIEVLFDQTFEDTINGTVVDNAISAEADRLEDDLVQNAIPRLETGLRDINSVMSSSFVVGRAMMETARTKAISRFSAELKARLIPVAADRWARHLEWNRSVVEMYAQVLKFYFLSKIDVDNHNFEIAAKNALWPFTILQYEISALGVLNGAKDITSDVAGASKASKILGGAMMGASAGAMTGAAIGSGGGPIGAAIGAGVGALVGWLS